MIQPKPNVLGLARPRETYAIVGVPEYPDYYSVLVVDSSFNASKYPPGTSFQIQIATRRDFSDAENASYVAEDGTDRLWIWAKNGKPLAPNTQHYVRIRYGITEVGGDGYTEWSEPTAACTYGSHPVPLGQPPSNVTPAPPGDAWTWDMSAVPDPVPDFWGILRITVDITLRFLGIPLPLPGLPLYVSADEGYTPPTAGMARSAFLDMIASEVSVVGAPLGIVAEVSGTDIVLTQPNGPGLFETTLLPGDSTPVIVEFNGPDDKQYALTVADHNNNGRVGYNENNGSPLGAIVPDEVPGWYSTYPDAFVGELITRPSFYEMEILLPGNERPAFPSTANSYGFVLGRVIPLDTGSTTNGRQLLTFRSDSGELGNILLPYVGQTVSAAVKLLS